MTLKECTKTELICIIESLALHAGSGWLEAALHDVEETRTQKTQAQAARLFAIMKDKAREIDQLYLPYSSDPYCEIPASVVAKAKALAHKYDEAEAKWCRLMGFEKNP